MTTRRPFSIGAPSTTPSMPQLDQMASVGDARQSGQETDGTGASEPAFPVRVGDPDSGAGQKPFKITRR